MKETPLRKVSKKRAQELAIFHSLKKHILSQRPFCECPSRTGAPTCLRRATELHHMRGRTGQMLCDERYLMPICPECHKWIHDNGREARERGLIQWI